MVSLFLILSTQLIAQNNDIKNNNIAEFYLYYGFSGLGSNMGDFQPTIRIKESTMVFTYEQNSYWGEKDERIDTVFIQSFRQSSIDSILEIVKNLADTTIKESNICIMSGGIHFMSVTNGTDTTCFELFNTFDYTALKIATILNQYLPKDEQIWANEQMIIDAAHCWEDLMKNAEHKKKKKKPAKKDIVPN